MQLAKLHGNLAGHPCRIFKVERSLTNNTSLQSLHENALSIGNLERVAKKSSVRSSLRPSRRACHEKSTEEGTLLSSQIEIEMQSKNGRFQLHRSMREGELHNQAASSFTLRQLHETCKSSRAAPCTPLHCFCVLHLHHAFSERQYLLHYRPSGGRMPHGDLKRTGGLLQLLVVINDRDTHTQRHFAGRKTLQACLECCSGYDSAPC